MYGLLLLQIGAFLNACLGSFGLYDVTASIPVLGDSMGWVQTYLQVVPIATCFSTALLISFLWPCCKSYGVTIVTAVVLVGNLI